MGRVSEQLLLGHFSTVDLLEPSRHLLDAAQKNLKAAVAGGSYPAGHALGQCLCQGLQQFEPQPGRCGACLLLAAADASVCGDVQMWQHTVPGVPHDFTCQPGLLHPQLLQR